MGLGFLDLGVQGFRLAGLRASKVLRVLGFSDFGVSGVLSLRLCVFANICEYHTSGSTVLGFRKPEA